MINHTAKEVAGYIPTCPAGHTEKLSYFDIGKPNMRRDVYFDGNDKKHFGLTTTVFKWVSIYQT